MAMLLLVLPQVAFWARTPPVNDSAPPPEDMAELFSYATHLEKSTGMWQLQMSGFAQASGRSVDSG